MSSTATLAQRKAFRELVQGLAASDPDAAMKGYCIELLESFRWTPAQLARLRIIVQNTAATRDVRMSALRILERIFLDG